MPQCVKGHMSFKLAIRHEIEMWNFLQLEFKHVMKICHPVFLKTSTTFASTTSNPVLYKHKS